MTEIPVPENLADVLQTAINTLIASPAIQDLTWQMTTGCQDSTINNMYFCDSASTSGSVTEIPHSDSTVAHVDSTGAHVDTNNHVDTPNHVDDKLVHDDAHFDVPGFIGIPHSDSHTDSVPHDDTSLHDDTSTPHDDTSAHYDTPAVHIDIPATTLNYAAGLTKLTGAGSAVVSQLAIGVVTIPEQPVYSFPFSAAVSFTEALDPHFVISVTQSPLPAINTGGSLPVTGTTGTMTGSLTLYCSGNPAGLESGYYAQIASLSITFPTSVTDYGDWSNIVASVAALGFDTSWMDSAGNVILSEVTNLINGLVAEIVMTELNKLLEGQLLLSCNC